MKDRKFLSILLLVALLLTTVINPSVSHATENTLPTEEGKVFAGWYKDAQFNTPLGENETTDNAYPKFVDENVLSVKLQITKGTETTSASSDLRLLTSVDSLKYRNVGFEITIGNQTITRTSRTVYTEITGSVGNGKLFYGSKVFSQESEAFVAYSITDIPNEVFTSKITVQPFWTTLDGTKVMGIARDFSIRLYAENRLDNCSTSEQFTGTAWSSVGHNATMSSMDDGSGSVQVNCWQGWPAASMTVNNKTYNEIMEYDYVSFKVYIESTTGLSEGKKEVVFWNDTQKMYLTPGEWHHLSISTADFVNYAFDNEKNAQAFKLIMVQNDGNWYDANAKAYIDDIYFIKDTGLVKLSDFVPDYAGQGGSFSHDVSISHTEDGIGTVKMSCDGRIWPHAAVKLGVTAEELSKYEALSFWIMMESPSGNSQVRMYVPAIDYADNYNVGQWYKITIPASKVTMDADGVTDLFFMLNDATGVGDPYAKICIDDVHLVGESNEMGLSAYVGSNGASFTYDMDVSHTADGSGSVIMYSNGNEWPRVSVNLGVTAEELSEYEALTFWIKPHSQAGGTEARIQIGQNASNYPVGTWSQIAIPVSQLGVDNGVVYIFNMLNSALELTVKDLNMQVYIDDIRLVRESNGIMTSDFVADYSGQGGSFSYNTTASHSNDGTGSVMMSCAGRIWPHGAVKLGMTADQISQYDTLSFWIMMESPSGNEKVRMHVPAIAQTNDYNVGEWYQITIPAAQVTMDANGVTDLFFMLNDTAVVGDPMANVYIDDICFVGESNGMGTLAYEGSFGAIFGYDLNASHTADGSGSVIMYSNGNPWARAHVKLDLTAEELSEYEALTFWIKPQSPAGGTEARIQVGQSIASYRVGRWHKICIPTSNLSVDNGVVYLFNMLNDAMELTVKDLNMQVYIDDIRLVRESNGIMTSDFVADYSGQGGSFSYDVNVSHTDDGSGSVKMSCDGRTWPHAAVKLGMTAEQISEYETLSFWIIMDSPSANKQVRMYVPAIDYADNYTVGQWYKITIPTSKVTVGADGVIDLFYMLNDSAGVGDYQAKIYIDDIVLE